MKTVKFTAPSGGDSNRLETSLIEPGMHLCTLYGICDLGTRETNFGMKQQVLLAFEFPQHMQVFYEGEDPQPTAIFCRETFSMGERANLRKKFVQPMIGRTLSDEEAFSFDFSTLLGKNFVATIQHSPDGKYANIASLTPLTEKNMLMFGLQTPYVQNVNDIFMFHLSMGLDHPNVAELYTFLQNNLKESEEGKAFLAQGGKFPERKDANTSSSAPSAPGSQDKKFVLLDDKHTLQQYLDSGWTKELLVQNGLGKWEMPTPAPSPVNATPTPPNVSGGVPQPVATPAPPSAPSAPAPAPVPSAPAPAQKHIGHGVQMNDVNQDVNEWIAKGWTAESLVQHGHAVFIQG